MEVQVLSGVAFQSNDVSNSSYQRRHGGVGLIGAVRLLLTSFRISYKRILQ